MMFSDVKLSNVDKPLGVSQDVKCEVEKGKPLATSIDGRRKRNAGPLSTQRMSTDREREREKE